MDESGEHFDQDAPAHLHLEKRTLRSTRLPAATNYAIGAMREGALHLTPLQAVLHMRPSFKHIDASSKAEAEAAEAEALDMLDDVRE